MTEAQYQKSIETEELQLTDFWQSFTYYSLAGFLFFMPIMILVFHLVYFLSGEPEALQSTEYYILIIPTIIGFMAYRFQKAGLKFQKIKTQLTWGELHVIIEEVAKQLDWVIASYDNLAYIGETFPSFSANSMGEQITIVFADGYVLINSVNNPNTRSGTFNIGNNKLNRETFINRIKAEGY